MPNDDGNPAARASPSVNDSDVNQSQPPIPDTPTPPLGTSLSTTRAPEYMSHPEKYQAAVRHIHTLESHNTRLYEDNCRLVNAVNLLNERLSLLSAPQNAQAHRFAEMQEKLHTCEAGRALINRKYQELLHSTAAGSPHRHLYEELQSVRDAYITLEKEYRLLADKYAKLKIIAQQQPQAPSRLFPVGRPEFPNAPQFRPNDQNRNGYASPTSLASSGPHQPVVDQGGDRRRRSSETVMLQPSHPSGPTPIATSWSAPLPTPPPSAPLSFGQISPTGFPVHAPMPAGSLSIPHHSPMVHDPRTSSGTLYMAQSQHVAQQVASEKLDAAIPLRHRRGETADATNRGPLPHCKEVTPTLSTSSPRAPKRPSSETQGSMSPAGDHKKPRIEGEADHLTTIPAVTLPANKTRSPLVPDGPLKDPEHPEPSQPDSSVRSFQDCVELIFEKDADVENGVFCGLCLDRHEAGMIPEPPDILIQPNFDVLVRHCMVEHPAVWDDLRKA